MRYGIAKTKKYEMHVKKPLDQRFFYAILQKFIKTVDELLFLHKFFDKMFDF